MTAAVTIWTLHNQRTKETYHYAHANGARWLAPNAPITDGVIPGQCDASGWCLYPSTVLLNARGVCHALDRVPR